MFDNWVCIKNALHIREWQCHILSDAFSQTFDWESVLVQYPKLKLYTHSLITITEKKEPLILLHDQLFVERNGSGMFIINLNNFWLIMFD